MIVAVVPGVHGAVVRHDFLFGWRRRFGGRFALAAAFFLVATLFSSVGHAGASGYLAVAWQPPLYERARGGA